MPPLEERIARRQGARAIIRASTSPASRPQIGTRYTYETIAYLRRHCPGVRFVWIMGADNLRSFHRWQKWRGIAAMVPIAVVDRLGPSLYASASAGRPGAGARPHPGDGGAIAGRPQAAGLGLPPRPEVAAVLDRAARRPS